MIPCLLYIDDLLTLIGETCRNILNRLTIIEQYIKNLTDLHLFKGEFGLYKIQRTTHTPQVSSRNFRVRLLARSLLNRFKLKLQTRIQRLVQLYNSIDQCANLISQITQPITMKL